MGILLNKSKNYAINGALDFWQRGTSFVAITNGTYSADRFAYFKAGAMVHTLTRDTDVPTLIQSGFIFPYSLRLNLTTPDTTLAAGDLCLLRHKIEGQVFAPLSNKPITISFWVKATIAGQYSVALKNSAQDRSLVKSFTIDLANTWEKKSLTIQHDNSGTWLYDTSTGLDISWVLASGSTFSTSSENTWLNGNFIAITGQLNGVNTGATDFRIAGVQVEEGTSPSNFERAGSNYINELNLCQRYYEKSYDLNTLPGTIIEAGKVVEALSAGIGTATISTLYRVRKRVAGSPLVYNPVTGAVGNIRVSASNNAFTLNFSGDFGFEGNCANGADTNATWHYTVDAEL